MNLDGAETAVSIQITFELSGRQGQGPRSERMMVSMAASPT
jgi:hypothetical protein